MAMFVLEIEICAAVEAPGSVGGGAALAHAIDAGVVAVGVVPGGDTDECFDVVYCIFEHVSLDASDLVGNAVGAADD